MNIWITTNIVLLLLGAALILHSARDETLFDDSKNVFAFFLGLCFCVAGMISESIRFFD